MFIKVILAFLLSCISLVNLHAKVGDFYGGASMSAGFLGDANIKIVDDITLQGSVVGTYLLKHHDNGGTYKYSFGPGASLLLGCAVNDRGRIEIEAYASKFSMLDHGSEIYESVVLTEEAGNGPDLKIVHDGVFLSAALVNFYFDLESDLGINSYFGVGVGSARTSSLGQPINSVGYQFKVGVRQNPRIKGKKDIDSMFFCGFKYFATSRSVYRGVAFEQSGVSRNRALADVYQGYSSYGIEAGIMFDL